MQSIYTNEVHGGEKMYWDRSQLKQMARNALHGSYWKSVLVAFLLGLTSASFASSGSAANAEGISEGYYSFEHYLPVILTFIFFAGVLALALRIFLLRPLEVGCRRYFLEDIIHPAELDCLKAGFSGNYRNVVWVMFCRDIFIFLWTLLLIVPGIVKSYEYRMVPYILAENPDLSREEVFALSKRMMDGDKMNTFILDLSFIGWAILTILTCGLVGIFYYQPYLALTEAALYQTLKKKVDRFFDDGGYTGGGYTDGSNNNGGYTGGGYNNGGYTGGGYTDGSNNNGGYTDGGYTGGSYAGGYNDGGYTGGGYADGSNNNGGYTGGSYIGGSYADGSNNNNGSYTGSDYSAGNDYSNHYQGSVENSDYTTDSSWEENKNPWAEDGRKNNPWEEDT